MSRVEELDRAFGAAVAQHRAAKGWTQKQVRLRLAAAFGLELSSTAMSRLETGPRPIGIGEAFALAALLQIDLTPFVLTAAAEVCARCDGEPPAGFTCNACGAEGVGADR